LQDFTRKLVPKTIIGARLFCWHPILKFFCGTRSGGTWPRRTIGAQTKNNLDCIKGLRNAFAHAVIPIDFDTPEVNAVCEQMTMPKILAPRAIEAATGLPTGRLPDLVMPRQRFQKICEAVAHNLFVVRSIGILL
jgi:hypothetical protein